MAIDGGYCGICGDWFDRKPKAHSRLYCYSDACSKERRRRITRLQKTNRTYRFQGGGVEAECAVCGELPHPGWTCKEMVG